MSEIYLDYNATTPIDQNVQEHIVQSLKHLWANPSSPSSLGVLAKNAIETARQELARAICAEPSDVIFTSCGTEASNMAIHSVLKNCKDQGFYKLHVVTSNVEHVATSNTLKELRKLYNISFTEVNVNKQGMLSAEDVVSAVTYDTCLITIMLANNETGVIFPISVISSAVKKINSKRKGTGLPLISLHTDASQAIGKIKVDVIDLGVDYLTIAGHKFYGPRIGALYVRSLGKENKAFSLIHGGNQERGYRPGTENTAMIVGLGKAALLVHENIDEYEARMKETRDYLEQKICEAWNDVVVNCKSSLRLPNTANISFRGMPCNGALLLKTCNQTIASTTAACHSQAQLSGVLIASGVPKDIASTAVRFSTGRDTTKHDIDIVVADIKEALHKLTTTE